eukprot:TRINITY_DN392_c0_g1_i2.p1 TRINITY_DN392_c0_g1~~TRINITY_DN392_c0_g1_i2.p1  ORF type:complete len:433 (-),score=74.94 TRINITY_DN392_c0_g1_i2:146-1444(-)
MKLTVMTTDERFVSLDVEPDELVENVKAILEVETQIPLHHQQLLFNGKEIPNTRRLNAVGVAEGDLLMVIEAPRVGVPSAGTSIQGGGRPPELRFNSDGSAANPIAFVKHLRSDQRAMENLLASNPDFARAVVEDDLEKVQNLLRENYRRNHEIHRQKQQELELMNADPFDVEAQRKIEEAIRQRNVDENWETAIEYNPEAFGRVIMLYVDMEVNGFPLKAFVDSGAQTTIISRSCAERCGLSRLLDNRFRGTAQGVGQAEIVGRIHVAPLKIGSNYYPCSFTVLDHPHIEFIFGLDMIRKHQCVIDLKDNVLRVGGGAVAVPFLQEKDLPLHLTEIERLHGSESSIPAPVSQDLRRKEPMEHVQPTAPIFPSGPADPGVPSGNIARAQQVSSPEAKVKRLMELGFDRPLVEQALGLFHGNEDQAASYLFDL